MHSPNLLIDEFGTSVNSASTIIKGFLQTLFKSVPLLHHRVEFPSSDEAPTQQHPEHEAKAYRADLI